MKNLTAGIGSPGGRKGKYPGVYAITARAIAAVQYVGYCVPITMREKRGRKHIMRTGISSWPVYDLVERLPCLHPESRYFRLPTIKVMG